MRCPYCDSDEIDTTGKFDGTVVGPDECIHDFECFDCGAWFSIRFAPIAAETYKTPEEVEEMA